jgi:hypothetical protein
MSNPIQWCAIPGYKKYLVSQYGEIFSTKTNKNIKPIVHDRRGHLYFFPTRGVRLYIHRAVLYAFIGECPVGMECRHLDGNPKNNNLCNLKWGTRLENAHDTTRHGHRHTGQHAAFSTMSNENAQQVRQLRKQGTTYRAIADIFNVSHTTIIKIAKGKRYVEKSNRLV